MTDQTEPQENQRYIEHPQYTDNLVEQDLSAERASLPVQPFSAPAESFGSFGPLPDYPAEIAASNPSIFSTLPPGPANVPPI